MSIAIVIQRSTLAQAIARFILRLTGWRTEIISPHTSRYVMIGAPHTSNWDFFVILMLMTYLQLGFFCYINVDDCGKYSNSLVGKRFSLHLATGSIYALIWSYSCQQERKKKLS